MIVISARLARLPALRPHAMAMLHNRVYSQTTQQGKGLGQVALCTWVDASRDRTACLVSMLTGGGRQRPLAGSAKIVPMQPQRDATRDRPWGTGGQAAHESPGLGGHSSQPHDTRQ